MTVAVVIGGASSVWAELELTQELCRNLGVVPKYIVCNDMIEHFSKECLAAVTLHADKLPSWIANRTAKGMCPIHDVWVCTREYKQKVGGAIFANHYMDDLGGSVGLLCCRIAVSHYGLRVILCGVPITEEGGHFVRGKPWTDVKTFEHRWRPHIHGLLSGKVRSWSGRTREWFGAPDSDFVLGNQEEADYHGYNHN